MKISKEQVLWNFLTKCCELTAAFTVLSKNIGVQDHPPHFIFLFSLTSDWICIIFHYGPFHLIYYYFYFWTIIHHFFLTSSAHFNSILILFTQFIFSLHLLPLLKIHQFLMQFKKDGIVLILEPTLIGPPLLLTTLTVNSDVWHLNVLIKYGLSSLFA